MLNVNFITRFFNLINRKRLTTVAGAWVYYFLTAFVPLLFLIVSAFGVFGVSLTHDLVLRLPEEFRSAGEKVIETAENSSKGATIFFIITATVNRRCEDVIKTTYNFSTVFTKDTFCSNACMDVTVNYAICVL